MKSYGNSVEPQKRINDNQRELVKAQVEPTQDLKRNSKEKRTTETIKHSKTNRTETGEHNGVKGKRPIYKYLRTDGIVKVIMSSENS